MATTLAPIPAPPRLADNLDAPPESVAPTVSRAKAAYPWLDYVHPEYARRKEGWERDERRMMGGDAVLRAGELIHFDWEDKNGEHYKLRKQEAVYINLPRQHASLVTGHLSKARPLPDKGLNFGTLGDVRDRSQIDTPTRAELMYYNIDGIGNDGSGMLAWLDGVDVRAQATGHRWIMVEAPETAPATYSDELAGSRPFAVEYSPLEVTNWHYVNGVLQWAIIRAVTVQPSVENGMLLDTRTGNYTGYYLLVRKGWDKLGAEFAVGGWWLFDWEKTYLREGRWDRTVGQIPLFPYFGRLERGSTNDPDMSASDTTELGQLAVEMMNTRSARKYDFWDACASKLYFMGASDKVMNLVIDQWKNSQLVAVPTLIDDETGQPKPVQIFDGSTGAVAAEVADKLEASQWEVARRLSIEKVTSTPDSSGASKNAGFAEASSPDLARRAQLREQAECTLIYFFELRWGFRRPRGFSQWPRDFDLEPLTDDIDAMFKTMRQASISSSTAEVEMLMQAFEERNIITDPAMKKTVRGELENAAKERAAQRAADAKLFGSMMGGRTALPPDPTQTPLPNANNQPSNNGAPPTSSVPAPVQPPNDNGAAPPRSPSSAPAQRSDSTPPAGSTGSESGDGTGAPRQRAQNQGPAPVAPDNQGRTPGTPERAAPAVDHAEVARHVAPVVQQHIAPLQQSHDALGTQVTALGTQVTNLTTLVQSLIDSINAEEDDEKDDTTRQLLLAIVALLSARGAPPALVANLTKSADGSTITGTVTPTTPTNG